MVMGPRHGAIYPIEQGGDEVSQIAKQTIAWARAWPDNMDGRT